MKNLLIIFVFLSFTISACQAQSNDKDKSSHQFEVVKTESEWKSILSPDEYNILREKGTERAWTGKFNKHKEDGMYICAACGNDLFASDTKFESGSGWPSFFKPAESKGSIVLEKDVSYGMVREEVLCSRCGGHLGHVFNDGPQPTGLRYCINSVALDFEKK